MPDERKVAWVLGSGFSAALGGPTLTGLLGSAVEGDIEVRYPAAQFPFLHSDGTMNVRRLFRHHVGQPGEVRVAPPILWGNAEEFLDYVDTAAETRPAGMRNPHAERLVKLLAQWGASVSPDIMRAAARRLIAAECSVFLKDVDVTREQWTPFRRWAESLTTSDTVITFNYDRVVERLRDAQNEDARLNKNLPSPIAVLTPAKMVAPRQVKHTPLLKLHGSVDWRRSPIAGADGLLGVSVDKEHFALTCPDEELAIATPGPSKQREGTIGYGALWEEARNALKVAEAIVFVGYRFPETDADARTQLLGAIGQNTGVLGSRSTLPIHFVLGNTEQSTRDTNRLASMLRFVLGRRRIEATLERPPATIRGGSAHFMMLRLHPLFAQEFFSLYERDDLLWKHEPLA